MVDPIRPVVILDKCFLKLRFSNNPSSHDRGVLVIVGHQTFQCSAGGRVLCAVLWSSCFSVPKYKSLQSDTLTTLQVTFSTLAKLPDTRLARLRGASSNPAELNNLCDR